MSSPFQSFSGDAPQGAGAEWEGRWGDARALDGRAIGAMNYFGDGDVASYGAQGGPNGSGGDRASGAFDAASPFDDAHDTPPDGLVLEPSSPSASPPTTASPSPTAAPSPTGPSPVAPVASPTGRPAAPAPVAILSLPGGFKTYEVEPSMNSSLVAYRCLGLDADEPFSAVSMVETLAPQFRTVCTMHFQKIGETTPESIQDASPLFSWLPEPSARQYTPVVVPYDSLRRDGQFGYLDQLWGVDGMLCFLGHDSGAMVTHLKSLVTKGVPGYSEDGGFLPYCWPTVLSQLLMAQPQRVVDSLLGGVISGVLMEVPDLPTGWQILAGREFESALANMGMARMDLEAAR